MQGFQTATRQDPYAGARAIRNTIELRGELVHTSSQTDAAMIPSIQVGIDENTQADMDIVSESKAADISQLLASIENDKLRYMEREKLLIAQMNAIRNQHLYGDQELRLDTSRDLSVNIVLSGGDLSMFQISPVYNRVRLDVRLVEGMDQTRILASGKTKESPMIDSLVEWTKHPLSLSVQERIGQITLVVSSFASSSMQSDGKFRLYPILLGEWMSPPFIPSLKEKGKSFPMHALFGDLGFVNFELSIS